MSFKSVDTARGSNAIVGGIAGVIFSAFGFFMGSIFPAEARYTWPMLFPLVFIVIGLGLLGLVVYGVLKNWTYAMELSGSYLKWSRVDLDDEEMGRLDLSEVSGITHYQGASDGGHPSLIATLKEGGDVDIPLLYMNGNDIPWLLDEIRENFKHIHVTVHPYLK